MLFDDEEAHKNSMKISDAYEASCRRYGRAVMAAEWCCPTHRVCADLHLKIGMDLVNGLIPKVDNGTMSLLEFEHVVRAVTDFLNGVSDEIEFDFAAIMAVEHGGQVLFTVPGGDA